MLFEEDKSIEEFVISKIVLPESSDEMIAHYPSGLLACTRARYYSWMSREDLEKEFGEILNKPMEIDEDWLTGQSIFKMGNSVESELKDWLNMAGLLPSPNRWQYRIRSRKFLISGNIDFVIFKDGMDIPIECKSSKKERYEGWEEYLCGNCGKKLWKNAKFCKDCGCRDNGLELLHQWKTVGYKAEPDVSHYAQLQAYLNIGKFQGQTPGKQFGYLYYYNKNTSERKWWKVQQDLDFWDEIVSNTKELMECVENRKAPERSFSAVFDINGEIKDSSDWQCKWCDWWKICWHDKIQKHLSEREKEIARLFGIGD